jgi:putative membrane protein
MQKVFALLGLMMLATFGFAQDTTDTQAMPSVSGMDADTLFVMTAAQGDLYEITSSQLALEQAESQEVKDFAQMMIDDHTATTEQLTAIAGELGVTPPTEPNPMQQFMLVYLQGLQGADFDTAYMRQQVVSHAAAVEAFTTAASGGAQNESLVAFANENLPTIEQHLTMAQGMAQPAAQ